MKAIYTVAAILLLASISSSSAQLSDYPYLTSPRLQFSTKLPNIVGKGNAVQVSPDGIYLYVSTNRGSLYTLNATSGEILHSFSFGDNDEYGEKNMIKSASGIVFNGDGSAFLHAYSSIGMDKTTR